MDMGFPRLIPNGWPTLRHFCSVTSVFGIGLPRVELLCWTTCSVRVLFSDCSLCLDLWRTRGTRLRYLRILLSLTRDRYYLSYHTPPQVIWGMSIGAVFGVAFYTVVELIPTRKPRSLLGQLRSFILENPVSTWIRLRDGWLVWDDGGKEREYEEWRQQLERKRR
jgi:hypothetical protein